MEIKESKYTVSTKDKYGNLLLYNSLVGSKSFCYIDSVDIEAYNSLLSSKNLSFRKGFEKSDYVLDHLLNKGIVTISDSDEDATLHNLHRKITNSKVLTLIINPTENSLSILFLQFYYFLLY